MSNILPGPSKKSMRRGGEGDREREEGMEGKGDRRRGEKTY